MIRFNAILLSELLCLKVLCDTNINNYRYFWIEYMRSKIISLQQAVKYRCDGKHYCTIAASNGIFGDPCYGIAKYLTATWECKTG